MRGHEASRPFAGERDQILEQLASALREDGYEVRDQTRERLRTKFDGKLFTTDPEKMRHFLDVYAEGEGLRFHFHTGLLASAWTQSDRQWAEARTDALLGRVGG